MQSTGHSSTHALSFTSMHVSTIVYVTVFSSGCCLGADSRLSDSILPGKSQFACPIIPFDQMRFRYAQEVDCEAVGRRVSIRYRLPDGKASDVVGSLEDCDKERFAVRN